MVVIGEKNLAKRYWSNLIDYFIVMGFSWVYVVLVGEPNDIGGHSVNGFPALAIPLFWFLYFPFSESVFHRTLGKATFNLIVVRKDGEGASIGQCILKRITDPFEIAFWGVPAVIAITQTEDKIRLGDMLGGTRTVSSVGTCQSCNEVLSLTTKEALKQRFKCPECGELTDNRHD